MPAVHEFHKVIVTNYICAENINILTTNNIIYHYHTDMELHDTLAGPGSCSVKNHSKCQGRFYAIVSSLSKAQKYNFVKVRLVYKLIRK